MKPSSGFSLVELLVAVFIFAVGLTGLSALQVAGVRSNQTAYYHSMATLLAYDIADRMRANPVGVAAGNYNQGTKGNSLTQCETGNCTTAQLANYDLLRWKDALAANLPGGTGMVCLISGTPTIGSATNPTSGCSTSTGNVYGVFIWWNDNRSGDDTTQQGFVTSFQLGY